MIKEEIGFSFVSLAHCSGSANGVRGEGRFYMRSAIVSATDKGTLPHISAPSLMSSRLIALSLGNLLFEMHKKQNIQYIRDISLPYKIIKVSGIDRRHIFQ